MDLNNLIDEIVKADPEFPERISPRRDAIKNITSFGSKVAVAAMPFAFATLFKKAYGQTATPSVTDVLNFALTAEYLESTFYNNYVKSGSYIPSTDLVGLQLIQTDENNHTKLLLSVLGSAAIAKPTFDFSGGKGSGTGPFATVSTNYDTFLALAQCFEDTGVRAYKGQAANLMSQPSTLTTALNIHSVEARHASYLRALRMSRGVAVKPWITGVNGGVTGVLTGVYAGEDNVSQGGVTITSLAGVGGNVSTNAATEAFDEPATMDAVKAILAYFIKA